MAKPKPTPSKRSKKTSATDTGEIREFISFIAQSNLSEVNIETDRLKLHVKRYPDAAATQPAYPPSAPPLAYQPQPRLTQADPGAAAPAAWQEAKPEVAKDEGLLEIKSPMIGTFYRAPNPESSSFVSVGDKVKKGQVVCVIEAMKLFNEIESEVTGTVVKVIAENATPVEYDQTLFLVKAD